MLQRSQECAIFNIPPIFLKNQVLSREFRTILKSLNNSNVSLAFNNLLTSFY